MKVPWSWLSEYCNPGMDPEQLADRLSMTGTEVERIAHRGAATGDGFVVAKVLSAEQHPDADRLKVCSVDAGEAEPRTIVCGAPNVDAGQTVAVALPGAVMPDGQKLGKAKLRGIESSGMILSETEMEVGTGADGIAVLETDVTAGTPLAEVLPISEVVLELEITPNRPDCLGVYGVARELHAITGNELAPAPWEQDADASGDGEAADFASILVEAPDMCPRFTGRVFTDVTVGQSPLWLKARLIGAGQRPINNVVDITNYVMLLTGQPLHAFDLDKVPEGEIIVRRAAEGEKLTTLDDVERSLDSDTVVVCDRNGPTAIAGIMGGQISEVYDGTTRILIEAANWNGPNILSSSGKLGLRSEASTRFEKQIHPDLTMRAQHVAARLLIEVCGARLVPGTLDVDSGAPEYVKRTIGLDTSRQTALLGMEVDPTTAAGYLDRLGLSAESDGEDKLRVGISADRHFDLTREVDLIEEVARVHGLDQHLPTTLPERGDAVGGLEPHQRLVRRVEDVLRDAGLDEAVTWHFVDPDQSGRLGIDTADTPAVTVHNPISIDQSAMRTNLIGGLLDAAAFNFARGTDRVGLFESGRVFAAEVPPAEGGVLAGQFAGERAAPATETHRIGCVMSGASSPPSWRGERSSVDFYDAKGLVELLCSAAGAALDLAAGSRPFLHPGKSAEIFIGGSSAGWLGEIHPSLCEQRDLGPSVGFELDIAALLVNGSTGHERYRDVTTYPAVYEDLSVVVDAQVSAGEIRTAILAAGGELLAEATVFDVYEGEQVGEGKRSLALRLEFRASDRTLTDAEVTEPRSDIITALEQIGAKLRG